MNNFFKFFLILFCFWCFTVTSQNQNSKWYFGNLAGLDFMTSLPTIITNGAMIIQEGASSIADAAGNTLFYTNGVTIYNKLNLVMANGTGLMGNLSTTQGALIVKQPGNANIYFVFTLDEWLGNGLRYSIVDMTLAAGMGSVTTKNALLYSPSSEKLCAVRHCNGNDIWVLSHEYLTNNFCAHLLTSTGVNNTPVITSIGTVLALPPYTQGPMKVSPTGNKIGLAIQSLSGGAANTGAFELYDFNSTTGVLSNSLSLGATFLTGYGCEFSPDGTKFYGAARNGTILYQWEICSGSPQAIISSQYTTAAISLGQMQRAIDGKIYIARSYQNGWQALAVIDNPNASGSGMNFNNSGQSVSPNWVTEGLPNFMFEKIPPPPFTYSANTIVNCSAISFTPPLAPTITVTACTSVGYSLTNMVWNFGDPGSGPSNTSTSSNPTHTYPAPGTYTAQLIYYYTCGGGTDTLRQQVAVGSVPMNSSSGFSVCSGQNLTLTAGTASSYSWSTGAITSSISVTPLVNTTYSVSGTNVNGCPYFSISSVNVLALPNITATGSFSVCSGQQATIALAGAVSYSINAIPSGSVITLSPATNTSYQLSGTAPNGCINYLTTNLGIFPPPAITVSGLTDLCTGQSTTLTAGGASSYTWSGNVNTSTINSTPLPGVTVYTVTGANTSGCVANTTITVNVFNCLGVEQKEENSPAKIYPNPFQGQLQIEGNEVVKIFLYNELGSLVLEKVLPRGANTLDLKSLNNGIYLLRYFEHNNAASLKLIKSE
jgi:hypothetical protein